MENKKLYRKLQQELEPIQPLEVQKNVDRGRLYHIYRDALAATLESFLSEQNHDTVFINGGYASNTVIYHSNHRSGSPSHRSCQIGTTPGTGGMAKVGWRILRQDIPRLDLGSRLWVSHMSTIHGIPKQTIRITDIPRLQQAGSVERTTRSRLFPRFAPYLLSLSQPPSERKLLGYLPIETRSQRSGSNGGDGHLGRERAHDSPASGSSHTPTRTEDRSTSESSEAESGLIIPYVSPSEGSESRTSTRPKSTNSPYGYVLANEDDYVIEDPSDHEEDEWDYCEVSSSKE